MDLHSLARSYLQAGGYEVRRESGGFLDLVHPEATRGRPARLLVWSQDAALAASRELTPAERGERDQREAAPAGGVPKRRWPRRRERLVTTSYRARLACRRASAEDGAPGELLPGGIRVPIQFFDTDYKGDTASGDKVRSALGEVLKQAERMRRAAQPFLIRRGLGPEDCVGGAADLVEHLDTALRDPGRGARLRVIDGAAGSGKTVAFNALLDASFKEFKAAKAQHVLGRRPIAFLPDHIRGEAIGYVDDVLDAAADAEMAQAVEPEQLRWLLKHGFAAWMFDGLDEFYAGDNDFFPFLEAELADPNSQAQILICTRDSLLSSSERVRGFIERQLERGGGRRDLRAGAVGLRALGADRMAGAGARPQRGEELQKGRAVRVRAAELGDAGRSGQAAVLLHGDARHLQGRKGHAEGRVRAAAVDRRPHGGARARQGHLPLAGLRRHRCAVGGDRGPGSRGAGRGGGQCRHAHPSCAGARRRGPQSRSSS